MEVKPVRQDVLVTAHGATVHALREIKTALLSNPPDVTAALKYTTATLAVVDAAESDRSPLGNKNKGQ